MLAYFVSYISKQKIKQSAAILILTLSFCAYFFGTYLMTSQDFSDMGDSLDTLFVLQLRKACVEDIIHSTEEQYVQNQTYAIYLTALN